MKQQSNKEHNHEHKKEHKISKQFLQSLKANGIDTPYQQAVLNDNNIVTLRNGLLTTHNYFGEVLLAMAALALMGLGEH